MGGTWDRYSVEDKLYSGRYMGQILVEDQLSSGRYRGRSSYLNMISEAC